MFRTIAIYMMLALSVAIGGCGQPDKLSGFNIVIILADDLGYGDLGCYGSEVNESPEIDALAEGGILFTDFHSNGPVCSPTRAALITGKYQQKSGIEGVVHAVHYRHKGLDQGANTIADYLKEKGYATGIIGKWHLGYDTAYSPLNFGFDYFKGFVSGNIDYHSHLDGTGVHDWYIGKKEIREEGYTTDLITEDAVAFIERNKDEPFFLYVAHEAPHFPFQDREDEAIRMEGKPVSEKGVTPHVKTTYKNMIKALDEGVGKVIQTLSEHQLLQNTLVFFVSDNGALEIGSNDPLRGYKGSLWEGAHRVPAIAYWDDKIAPGVNNELLMTMDLLPTIAALISDSQAGIDDLDGIDFSASLFNAGSDADNQSERTVFFRFKDQKSARKGAWKLLVQDDSTYLFNLDADLAEQFNVLNENDSVAAVLESELAAWEKELEEYPVYTR
jgi:arylsulfatase A